RNTSPRRKVARILQRTRLRRKKISIKRKNAIRFTEVVNRVDRLTKSHHRAGARVVVVYRLILVPLRLRKLSQNSFQLRGERWRRYRLRQKSYSCTLLRALLIERGANLADESCPGARLFAEERNIRTIRIIEAQHRGLRENVGGAGAAIIRVGVATVWMVGISFQLGGAAFV